MKHEHYLMSFHGLDIGLTYALPKNVRVFMYCYPGKPIDATECNESLTWYVATMNDYDDDAKYLKQLRLTIGDDKYQQLCAFSGNLCKEKMNMVPDLYLEDERSDFRTGLYHLPARFDRVFIRDKYSSVDNTFYKAGQRSKLDIQLMHQKLKPYIKKNAELPNQGFYTYFINPGSMDKIKYKDLDFVIVPQPRYFFSYFDLCKRTGKPFEHTKGIPQYIVKKSPVKIRNRKQRGSQPLFDHSSPNSNNAKHIQTIQTIQQKLPGVYLSDVIRLLCNKHPTSHITITVSACRSFYDIVPKSVQVNQQHCSRISVNKYLMKYAHKDK